MLCRAIAVQNLVFRLRWHDEEGLAQIPDSAMDLFMFGAD